MEIDGIYYLGYEERPDITQAYTPESGVTMGDVVIPSYIEYNGANYIVANCYFPNASIMKLTLPPTINNADYSWFPNSNIGELVLSEGISQLDYDIFERANINILDLPKSLKMVRGSQSVTGAGQCIDNIRVKDLSTILELDVHHAGTYSSVAPVWGCRLYVGNELVKNLVVPDNVKVINDFVFQGYPYLESVDTGNGVERIGTCAFEYCDSLKDIKIGKRVSTICEGAFNFRTRRSPMESRNLRTVVIPNNVDTIYGMGDYYPRDGMVKLILEDGTKDLIMSPYNGYALGYCGRNVKFRAKDFVDNSNHDLGVFRGLRLDTFEIGGLVSDISDFDPAKRPFVMDEDTLKEIISHAVWPPKACEFAELQYKTVTLRVPTMSKHLYRNAPIWENFFKRGRTAFRARNMNFYGDAARGEASLTFGDEDYEGHLVIPDEVVYDGDEVVYSVTSVGSHSFAGCDKLWAVTVPASVTAIENDAFTECVALDSIVLMSAVPPKCDIRSFKRVAATAYAARAIEDDNDIFANTTLYVPVGSVTAYRNADGWGEFANIQEQKAVTSLDEAGVASPLIKVSGDGIVIANGDGCPVEVYSIDGQLVNRSLSYGGERIALPKGAYIVKVGASVMKVSL